MTSSMSLSLRYTTPPAQLINNNNLFKDGSSKGRREERVPECGGKEGIMGKTRRLECLQRQPDGEGENEPRARRQLRIGSPATRAEEAGGGRRRRGRQRHKDSRSGGEWRSEPVWQGPLDDDGSLMHS